MNRPKADSPLKVPIKRSAGQSTHEQLEALLDEQFLPAILAAVFATTLAAIEWARYIFHWPVQPILMSLFALVAIVWAI